MEEQQTRALVVVAVRAVVVVVSQSPGGEGESHTTHGAPPSAYP